MMYTFIQNKMISRFENKTYEIPKILLKRNLSKKWRLFWLSSKKKCQHKDKSSMNNSFYLNSYIFETNLYVS